MSGGPLLLQLEACTDLAAAGPALAAALDDPRARRGEALADASSLRIEQPLERGADLLGWLRDFPALPRAYWADRDGEFALAAVGTADEAEGEDATILAPLLDAIHEGGRLVVTCRFDPGSEPDPAWRGFGRVRARLPLLELRRDGASSTLAVNLKLGEGMASGWFDAQRRSARNALLSEGGLAAREGPVPPLDGVVEADADRWREQVAALLDRIASGELDKAVLARCAQLAREVDPLALFEQRARGTPGAFHFFVQPSAAAAFLGASPEMLYRRRGRVLETEALAGTRARGQTPDEDRALADALLGSEKDLREHGFVRRHIVERLEPLSTAVESAGHPAVQSVAQLHHLRTGVHATLREDVDDAAILRALHPTPAVCGMPTDAALAILRASEGFDRGLYGGPVGCVGRDDAVLAVAIRSALVTPRAVRLYAGAGIVEGSDPDLEWQETVDKMKGLADLLDANA